MNTTLHLPTRPHLSTVKLSNAFRRYDDRPEVERNASPSELAMRQTINIPLMRR